MSEIKTVEDLLRAVTEISESMNDVIKSQETGQPPDFFRLQRILKMLQERYNQELAVLIEERDVLKTALEIEAAEAMGRDRWYGSDIKDEEKYIENYVENAIDYAKQVLKEEKGDEDAKSL